MASGGDNGRRSLTKSNHITTGVKTGRTGHNHGGSSKRPLSDQLSSASGPSSGTTQASRKPDNRGSIGT